MLYHDMLLSTHQVRLDATNVGHTLFSCPSHWYIIQHADPTSVFIYVGEGIQWPSIRVHRRAGWSDGGLVCLLVVWFGLVWFGWVGLCWIGWLVG